MKLKQIVELEWRRLQSHLVFLLSLASLSCLVEMELPIPFFLPSFDLKRFHSHYVSSSETEEGWRAAPLP